MSGHGKTLRAVRVLADRLEDLRAELREERRAARRALLGRFDRAERQVLAKRAHDLLTEFLNGGGTDQRAVRVARQILSQLAGGES